MYDELLEIHQSTDIETKVDRLLQLRNSITKANIETHWGALAERPLPAPGMYSRIRLVHPSKLKRRSVHTPHGKVAMVHALAHIEFNAINLALDAALRFTSAPSAFVLDWLLVAVDEARHFRLLQQRLKALDSDYGMLPAHNGLWSMAEQTADDVLARMAIVPRVLEARGLDVTPAIRQQFLDVGDEKCVAILDIILHDEVKHVAAGNKWFRYFCADRNVDPLQTFEDLIKRYCRGSLRGPFNNEKRLESGFVGTEIDLLQRLAP